MTRWESIRLSVTAAIATCLVTTCASSGSASTNHSSQASVRVLAAASLSKVFPKIGQMFSREHPGVAFTFSFGGTDLLAAQIEQGLPADVFAGASAKYGDRLFTEHLIDQPKPFCTNQLVLVVPSSNPAGIHSLRDLATKDVKLVIGSETVPIGTYTRTVLKNLDASLGPGYSTKVLSHVVSNELDVESVLTKVRTGEADAGLVYVTDALAAGSAVTAITLPQQAQAVATYPVAVLRASAQAPLAQTFVDFVLSSAAQQVLIQAGFGPPKS